MDQYTNIISRLKLLPRFGNNALQRMRTQLMAKRIQLGLVVEAKAKDIADTKAVSLQTAKDSLSTNPYDKSFQEFTIAYNEPKAKKPKTTRQKPKTKPKGKPAEALPTPLPKEYKLYREYDSKGIFFKSDLKSVMKRDTNGNVIINVGEDLTKSTSFAGEDIVIVETIKAPKSGHRAIDLNINRSE